MSVAPSIVGDVLRAPGRPLDAATRAFMEPRFGHDFSQVRVHADNQAARSADAVQAQAYTVGRDVVFAHGRYAPGTDAGRRLLAHELAHVTQQARGAVPPGISHPEDIHEQEASRISHEVMQRSHPAAHALVPDSPRQRAALAPIQRQVDGEPAPEAAPAEAEEEGIEINPDELMLLPRWHVAEQSVNAAAFPSGMPPALQRQKIGAASHCDTPAKMRAVTSGTFEGGKTLDDYFPDLVGAGYWGSNKTAGPFDTGTRAGSSVQLVGDLPIPCATSPSPTTLAQSATIVRARADGKKMRESGKDLEGQTIDDIKRSRRDQSKAPFRQTWTGAVSMADPISGIPYASLKSYEWEVNLSTSLTGAGGTVATSWGVTVEAKAGKVSKNEVR